jgi:hypothetical protein
VGEECLLGGAARAGVATPTGTLGAVTTGGGSVTVRVTSVTHARPLRTAGFWHGAHLTMAPGLTGTAFGWWGTAIRAGAGCAAAATE